MSIQKKPAARHIQPIGFPGRLEAIRAPTIGKARKGTKINRSSRVLLVPGASCAKRARTCSGMLAKNMATQRAASDQASQAEARVLTLVAPRACSQKEGASSSYRSPDLRQKRSTPTTNTSDAAVSHRPRG